MNFLKNRTIIGVICIVLSLIICFGVTPLFNEGISQKIEIVRVTKDIVEGEEITRDMVKVVEVGGYNLPKDVIKNIETVIGTFAVSDMTSDDYIMPSKIAQEPANENSYLYRLDGEQQAISITVKSFATGLSGKLKSGDIISIIAPNYKNQGSTVIPLELQYVEVIAVTAGSGYDANTESSQPQSTDEEKELPATVTLLVAKEQAKVLATLETEGSLHITLAHRGNVESANKFLTAQQSILDELYAKPTESEVAND